MCDEALVSEWIHDVFLFFFCFFADPATTEIYTLSLHDALPISVTLANVEAPAANLADEPLSNAFSLEQATRFLDSASLQWQKQRKCMTCHTNYAYLYARPGISADAPAHREVRGFAEQLVQERWKEKGQIGRASCRERV